MATSTLIAADFLNDLLKGIQDQAMEWAVGLTKTISGMIWAGIKPYWLYIVIGIFILLIWRTIKALGGYWAPLGSLLYHIIYFGLLAGLVAFKGWEILFNPWFDLIALVFYFIVYWIVGLILKPFRNRA